MTRRKSLQALLAALLLAAAGAALAQDLTQPPGGLAPANVPQFILLTHDDAVNQVALDAMNTMLGSRPSSNGCRAAATFFTQSGGTDCGLLKQLYDDGHEIADHTMNHQHMKDWGVDQIREEVLGARAAIAACGIPEADVVGYRSPFLEANPATRQVLADAGFLYDSTVIEPNAPGQSASNGAAARIWPFSLASGFGGVHCNWSADQSCDPSEAYPLWEVPAWVLDLGSADAAFSMDYGNFNGRQADTYEVLRSNFEASYNGNRAPLPIFIHSITPWYSETPQKANDVARFLDEALSKPDVYLVTMRQLLAWMQNPVPASQLTPEALGCGNAGGAPGGGSPAPLPTTPSPDPEVGGESPSTSLAPPDDICTVTLTAGQTLEEVATSAGLSLDELASLNPQIVDLDMVEEGQQITIC